jgi:hypothetical protein
MKKQILTIVMAAGLLISATTPAFACSVAGPNKHVGQVTAVNAKAGTFTIMDAETRKPITFAAAAGILKDAAKAKGSVMVSYKQSDGKMVAKDIHF